ncbi:hypothetical protein [Stenotrophomonas acidaminiphila]|uniref:hypothetical protein n=1 Tax=Stenotrophomonas acidaminiphila TaxID=128780 RepID=UPI0028B12F55|nr:hypothetical protein [Stenotrophomonas acidaminiphila]
MENSLPPFDPTDPIAAALAQIQGDQLALTAAVHALIAIHPEPVRWAAALEHELDRLREHWLQFPDPGQYQTENRIEDWCNALRTR